MFPLGGGAAGAAEEHSRGRAPLYVAMVRGE